jgi:hypothetical protein
LRVKSYLPQICGTIKWRLNNKAAKTRQQAADLIGRIAVVMKSCGEEQLMGHLGLLLYILSYSLLFTTHPLFIFIPFFPPIFISFYFLLFLFISFYFLIFLSIYEQFEAKVFVLFKTIPSIPRFHFSSTKQKLKKINHIPNYS